MREKTERIVREWTDACDAEVSIAVLGGAWKPSILSSSASTTCSASAS